MPDHAHIDLEPYPGEPDQTTTRVGVAVPRGEQAWLAQAASGDADAWAKLVDLLQPTVWAATGALGLPTTRAAEVCELVWLTLAQRLDDAPDPLRPWLLEVVENEANRWQGAKPASQDRRLHIAAPRRQPIITSD
jgi:hypothetical protein